jgi:hypothetical protein
VPVTLWLEFWSLQWTRFAVNKLLVLTADPDRRDHDPEIVVRRGPTHADTYFYVETVDHLLHYRHESVPEAEARRLIE